MTTVDYGYKGENGIPDPETGRVPMIDISRALATPGWMRPEELTWLAEQAQTHFRIIEIGSHLGRSTRALAENTRGVVFAVDDWRGHSEFIGNLPAVVLFGAFCENVLDLINSRAVHIVKDDHANLLEQFNTPHRADMTFIDGEHKYESVSRDIRNCLILLAKGALICGHDYDWHDVQVAVDELVPKRQLVEGTSLWFWEVE